MTVANLKIGGRKFVVVPERDFDRMKLENKRYRQLVEEDHALGKLAEKELKKFRKSGSRGIPWGRVKKNWGCDMPHQVIFTDAASRLPCGIFPAHIQKRVSRWISLLAEDHCVGKELSSWWAIPAFDGFTRAKITWFCTRLNRSGSQ